MKSKLSAVLLLVSSGCGPSSVNGSGDSATTTESQSDAESGSESDDDTTTGELEPDLGSPEPDLGGPEPEPGDFINSIVVDDPVIGIALGVLGSSTPGGPRRLAVIGLDDLGQGMNDLLVHAVELDGSSSWIVGTDEDDADSIEVHAGAVATTPDGGLILGGTTIVYPFVGGDVNYSMWMGALDSEGAWLWSNLGPLDFCHALLVRNDETIAAAVGGDSNQILLFSLAGQPLAMGSSWGDGLRATSLVELSNGELVAGASTWLSLDIFDPVPPQPEIVRVFHFDALGEPLGGWSQNSPVHAKIKTGELAVENDELLIAAAGGEPTAAELTWIGGSPSGPEASWWSPWSRPFGVAFQSSTIQTVAHPDGGVWLIAEAVDQIVLSRWQPGAAAPSSWTSGPHGALRDAVALPEEQLLAVLVRHPNYSQIDFYQL